MTVYGEDPVQTARGFLAQGATCLHAVDLDGARDGSPQNREVIRRWARCHRCFCRWAAACAPRRMWSTAALSLGVHRAILGTVAVTDFAFTARMGSATASASRSAWMRRTGWWPRTAGKPSPMCQALIFASA